MQNTVPCDKTLIICYDIYAYSLCGVIGDWFCFFHAFLPVDTPEYRGALRFRKLVHLGIVTNLYARHPHVN